MYPHHLHQSPRPCPECHSACGISRRPPLNPIEIILLKEELQHDILSDIHRIERRRQLQETPILTNDEADGYTITRQIDRAISHVVTRMQAYLFLPSPYVHRISTNHAGGWEEKSIYLAMPPTWPTHCIDALRDAVHHYIVKSVEYNLLLTELSNDPLTAACLDEADNAYNEINALINARLGRTEIHPTPFG